ncbi:aggregation-promoting factor C-terminal-like domain-containing protein [Actinomadura harenae]|uniref:Lytic transglycosylase domain-containing protein n=1 Tax=Actinomadura harenae TaxID=2483351 RepID=A0A3M2M4L4_9ACTN|nr:lytic transglycosylase domain-containing protein [Actinomadura harenae]RMI44506.1 lytic transglycosylase domain-containing protein [Actinomadura harenae]
MGVATALVATPLLAAPVRTTLAAAERVTGAAGSHRRASASPPGPVRLAVERRDRRDRRTRRVNRNKSMARGLMNRFGWRSARQFRCLEQLWAHESRWNERAHSASGAHGIPQALPGVKMAAAGPHWESNARTQIRWGLRYVRGRYSAPCTAWGHWQATGWY